MIFSRFVVWLGDIYRLVGRFSCCCLLPYRSPLRMIWQKLVEKTWKWIPGKEGGKFVLIHPLNSGDLYLCLPNDRDGRIFKPDSYYCVLIENLVRLCELRKVSCSFQTEAVTLAILRPKFLLLCMRTSHYGEKMSCILPGSLAWSPPSSLLWSCKRNVHKPWEPLVNHVSLSGQ